MLIPSTHLQFEVNEESYENKLKLYNFTARAFFP